MLEDGLYFSEDHVFVLVDAGVVRLGLSEHAAESLDTILAIDNLPQLTQELAEGETFCSLETDNGHTLDLPLPLSGEVAGLNTLLEEDPNTVKQGPNGDGWVVEMELDEATEQGALMTEAEYQQSLKAVGV